MLTTVVVPGRIWDNWKPFYSKSRCFFESFWNHFRVVLFLEGAKLKECQKGAKRSPMRLCPLDVSAFGKELLFPDI